jgi:hypothetical protein
MTLEQVLHELTFLSQLIDMDKPNAPELGRLQAVLDLNNITAMTALQRVRASLVFTT